MTKPDSTDATSSGRVLKTYYSQKYLIASVTLVCLFMIQLAYGHHMLESTYVKAYLTLIYGFGSIGIGYNYWKNSK